MYKPLCTIEAFEGESLEDKLRRINQTGEPIEAISPLIYTERKDGVLPETNIRSDKWETAQAQMDKMTLEHRKGRAERIMDALKGNEETKTNEVTKTPENQA